ncbi:MAG: YraN family protein [Clostridia bacterium]|jgi:putative endonuclease|nr:YraN family protein [Clostridia bacterium]
MNTRLTGAVGEKMAEGFLKKQGYKIIERNYHASRLAEIDIVAKHKGFLVFVEVKLRNGTRHGMGREAVNEKKQEHIRYAASHYLTFKVKKEVPVRFDVIEITVSGEAPEIELIQNAF